MTKYTFPDEPVIPKKPLVFSEEPLSLKDRISVAAGTAFDVLYHWVYRPVTRPIRALILAYSDVLTGQKIEEPYKWSEI